MTGSQEDIVAPLVLVFGGLERATERARPRSRSGAVEKPYNIGAYLILRHLYRKKKNMRKVKLERKETETYF